MDTEKCSGCQHAFGNRNKPDELGCTKTFEWTICKYLEKCPIEKENSKSNIFTLNKSQKPQNEPKERLIKIGLSNSELERIMNGETIQTQYHWLVIGKALE